MRKVLIATIALFAMTVSVEAQQRRDHRHGYQPQHRQHFQQRNHYRPPQGHHRSHNRGHNAAPWIAGAIGLGLLGALTYDQWGRPVQPRCWNEYIGVDRYGRQVHQQVCN